MMAAPADLEEALRDLAALCEGLRALCRHGEAGGVALVDLEPLAATAAYLTGGLVPRVQGLGGGGGPAGGNRHRHRSRDDEGLPALPG